MSQVIRARPLRRWEYWRLSLERLYHRVHMQLNVVLTFLVACALGVALMSLLGR
jgi:hypothetical protein